MKKLGYLLFSTFVLAACSDNADAVGTNVDSKFVDKATPAGVQPENDLIGDGWKLEFSDEFNDGRIDFDKWIVKDESRGSRPALGITEWFFKPEAVEEKDDALVIKAKKGLTQKQAAAILSLPRSTISNDICKIRKLLESVHEMMQT